MPATVGTQRIPLDRFAATITTDRPLAEDPTRAPGATEQRIAAHVAGLVDDGDTMQLGVGSLGAAVLDALAEHEDLGFHTGMVTDGLLRLVDKGVATGSRKEIDPGLIVAGTALGSAELYHRVSELPARFLPTSYTHSPQVLSQLHSLVSVNFAVEVDLTGQVGAEVSRGVYVGAVNRVGHEQGDVRGNRVEGPGLDFWGGSFIADPFGRIIAKAAHDKEEILIGEVDTRSMEDVRRNWPFLRDRRIDAYAPIVNRFLDATTLEK